VTQERLEGYAEPTHWMPLPEPPAAKPNLGHSISTGTVRG
jgi:hypothetical protein